MIKVTLPRGRKVETMNVSQLIGVLKSIENHYGDIPIFTALDYEDKNFNVLDIDTLTILDGYCTMGMKYPQQGFQDAILLLNKSKQKQLNREDLFNL